MNPTQLESPFFVATPMGEALFVEFSYPSCMVSMGGMDSLANLMLLEM